MEDKFIQRNSEANRFELREPIKSFLKWLRDTSNADACVLYLISKAMHNEEKKLHFLKRFPTRSCSLKDGTLSVDEVDKYEILTFIGVADTDDKKKWVFDYSNRPDKYVVVLDGTSTEFIKNEGITGMTSRLRTLTYIPDESSIRAHQARGDFIREDDVSRKIHLPCKKLIAIPILEDEKLKKGVIGVIRLDLYGSDRDFSQEFHTLASNKEWVENDLYKYINSTLKFLVKVGKEEAEKECYKKLYKGENLLDGLIDIREKIKKNTMNDKVFKLLFHLFLVFQRYTYMGHDEIIKRVIYFIEDMCKATDLPASDLKKLLEAFKSHENLMLYDIEQYRDHFMHQFHTFVLGYIIINLLGIDKIKDSINGRLRNTEHYRGITLEEDSIIRIWILTSLFHDICYLLEKYNEGIQNFLENMIGVKIPIFFNWSKIFEEDQHTEHLLKLTDLFRSSEEKEFTSSRELLSKYFQVVNSKQDHGVLSALLLIKAVLSNKDPIRDAEPYLAGLAISIHNESVFNYLKVGTSFNVPFEEFPIEFLLAYCDTAQEWGRKRRKRNDLSSGEEVTFKSIKLKDKVIVTELDYSYSCLSPGELVKWALERADRFSSNDPCFKIVYKFKNQPTFTEVGFQPTRIEQSKPVNKFLTAKAQWEAETAMLSSVTEIAMHPAYQQIIGMGKPAIPLILSEMKGKPGHWFWALKSITGEDPVLPEQRGRMKEMTEAWLRWGKEQGYLR